MQIKGNPPKRANGSEGLFNVRKLKKGWQTV
jgi:hypothetical protein